jgi:hypothetical protein
LIAILFFLILYRQDILAKATATMNDLSWVILILTAALAAHLIEEIRTGFRERFPLGVMPKSLFIGINIIVYTFCLAALLLSIFDYSLAVPFAWILGIATLVNGTGHIGIMLWSGSYFPGGLTSPLLILGSAFLIIKLV